MNIQIRKQKNEVTVWPEKLYSQREVDTSLREQEKKLTRVGKIQEETQIINNKVSTDRNAVEGLVRKSNRILVSISSRGFPFDLFPDTINIEEGRITIITRSFFSSSQVHSVDIKEISNVFINMAPFFAQLVIVSKTFTENEIRIKNLRKEEAIFARRIIEGLRIFESEQIDTSNYTKGKLIAKLEELSTTEIVM